MDSNPLETLKQGAKLLEPLLVRHGFAFKVTGSGSSSGGNYAAAEFRRGDRWLEFHFRFSLGLVAYHLGASSMDHIAYMQSVLGRRYASRYPGFSNDPLVAFHDLLLDLEAHCGEFLDASDEVLQARIIAATQFQNLQPRIPD
jgi:hypothetical protein